MRAFINLFISISVPISALFIIAAIGYFTLSYDLNKAIKLGMLSGVMIGLGTSLLLAVALFIKREIQAMQNVKRGENVPMAENVASTGPVDTSLMLLMDKELAFEVALHSIIDQHIGEVNKGDKKKGTISIHTPEQFINIAISTLTKHSVRVELKADTYSKNVQQIINYIKTKEHSFLQY